MVERHGATRVHPGYPVVLGYPAQEPYTEQSVSQAFAVQFDNSLQTQPGQGQQTTSKVMPPKKKVKKSRGQVKKPPPPDRPSSWINLSMFTCICLCPVLGLLAFFFSYKVDTYYDQEKYAQAMSYSKTAKWLNVIGIICGVLLIGLVLTIHFVRRAEKQ